MARQRHLHQHPWRAFFENRWFRRPIPHPLSPIGACTWRSHAARASGKIRRDPGGRSPRDKGSGSGYLVELGLRAHQRHHEASLGLSTRHFISRLHDAGNKLVRRLHVASNVTRPSLPSQLYAGVPGARQAELLRRSLHLPVASRPHPPGFCRIVQGQITCME